MDAADFQAVDRFLTGVGPDSSDGPWIHNRLLWALEAKDAQALAAATSPWGRESGEFSAPAGPPPSTVEPASDVPEPVAAIHAAIHKDLQLHYMIGKTGLAPRDNLLASLRLCMNAKDYQTVECFLRGVGSDEAARHGRSIQGRLLFALENRYAEHLARATSPWPTSKPENRTLEGVPIARDYVYDERGNDIVVYKPLYSTLEPAYFPGTLTDDEADRTGVQDPIDLMNRWLRRFRERRAARVRDQRPQPPDSTSGRERES
jgi:hypothetical protein